MTVPDVLLFSVQIVNLDLDVVSFLTLNESRQDIKTLVLAGTRQTEGESNILGKLLGKLVGLVDLRLNLSCHRVNFNFVSLLTLNLSLIGQELGLLLFNLALVLCIFFLHGLSC